MNEQHKLHLFLDFFLPHHHCHNSIFQLVCNDNNILYDTRMHAFHCLCQMWQKLDACWSTLYTDYVPLCLQTQFGERAFSHDGPSVWNAVPEDIHATADSIVLRRQLKTYYFSLASNVFWFSVLFTYRMHLHSWCSRFTTNTRDDDNDDDDDNDEKQWPCHLQQTVKNQKSLLKALR